MLLADQPLLFLLVFISLCFASPLDYHQSNVTSLASCAPEGIRIDQFTSFSGSADVNPHVSFFLTNPNAGAPSKVLCDATLGSNGGSFNSSSFYSCEQAGTGFNWRSGQLSVFQYQLCTNGLVNTSSKQVAISAQGEIITISYPGEFGGEYFESVTGSNSIPVVDVQEAQRTDGEEERAELAARNVTCGYLGPFNVVYKLASCDLTDMGPPL